MERSRRHVLLGTLPAVYLTGCLESDGPVPTGTDDDESPAPDPENESATVTPATADPTPSEPPDGQPSPDGSDSTPDATDEGSTPTPADEAVFPGYEMTTVVVRTPDGDSLGWVRAAIADTADRRRTGLSDTDELPERYGMLFVFGDIDERAFVMPEMEFGIDIVFADSDGVITTIHHAPQPGPDEDGAEQRYVGRGQYVLEVNKHWTTERGVEAGDVLAFDLPD